jgi:hypothetical protein
VLSDLVNVIVVDPSTSKKLDQEPVHSAGCAGVGLRAQVLDAFVFVEEPDEAMDRRSVA